MVCYSSAQLYKDWRYSVGMDFTTPSGKNVKYAPDGLRTWGSEKHKITFPKGVPSNAAVNCDGTLLAIAVEEDIHIFTTTNFSLIFVCKGHISTVGCLAFQPGNARILVSSAQGHTGYSSEPTVPTILIWNLYEEANKPLTDTATIAKIASEASETCIKGLLHAQSDLNISTSEKESVTAAIEPLLTRILKSHKVLSQESIHGRLVTSFSSSVFSPDGSHLIYLPGSSPRSNGNAVWDAKVYSMATHSDILTLSGHTDAIMWTGHSPDQKFIATVSWDQSMRIWNSTTGLQKGRFNTSGQNWTGAFSPDSKRFAGTCGDETLFVYSIINKSTLGVDSNILTVSEGNSDKPGYFFLFDVDRKEVVQERVLSTDKCPIPNEYKSFIGRSLEVGHVQFVDDGKKVVVQTGGDGGIETYDLERGVKWRFARPGVQAVEGEKMRSGEDESTAEDYNNPLVRGGYSMTVWTDKEREKVWIASMDGDAVRICDVPTAEIEAS